MKRAAIYLRVSTSAQAKRNREPEGYSIPAQREACLRKAASLDAEVVGEYVDRGESAKTADRAELRALLERVKQQQDLDYVIVHKVDRLARNRYDDATISYTLKTAGIELVSVTENIDDTPFGRFMHAIVAANAEFYSANLAAEARKGLVQKAKTGGTPTRAPIGYLNVRKIIDGLEIRTVEIDPERAPHVRWAITAYATGAYTLDTLQNAITDRGLLTRPTPTRPAKPLSRSQLAVLLVNPYYIGIVRYAGVEYNGNHEPLIDCNTFQRAHAVLEAHGHAEERDRKHDHYLKGTLYCGRCDSRMSLTHAKGNGGTYPTSSASDAPAATAANSHTSQPTRSSAPSSTYTPTSHHPPNTWRRSAPSSTTRSPECAHKQNKRPPVSSAGSPSSPTSAPSSYTPTTKAPSRSTSSTKSKTASSARSPAQKRNSPSRNDPRPTYRARSTRPSTSSPAASTPTPTHPPTCAANGTKRYSYASTSTTKTSSTPRSPSPSPPSPRQPSPTNSTNPNKSHATHPRRTLRITPPLLTATVQIRLK
jgi:DNA invertase Pin-like site-specific DNA recombinase